MRLMMERCRTWQRIAIAATEAIIVPFRTTNRIPRREIVRVRDDETDEPLGVPSDKRQLLLRGIAKARAWANELAKARIESIEAIAAREDYSPCHVRQMLPRRFWRPTLSPRYWLTPFPRFAYHAPYRRAATLLEAAARKVRLLASPEQIQILRAVCHPHSHAPCASIARVLLSPADKSMSNTRESCSGVSTGAPDPLPLTAKMEARIRRLRIGDWISANALGILLSARRVNRSTGKRGRNSGIFDAMYRVTPKGAGDGLLFGG
jgi:hypothetical protein